MKFTGTEKLEDIKTRQKRGLDDVAVRWMRAKLDRLHRVY